jgi:transcriptional regulator with XRE-family HTH domain
MPIVANFLENFTAAMKKAGNLTYQDLEDISGVPKRRITTWAYRKTVPNPDDLEKISTALKVEPHYFFMKPGTQLKIEYVSCAFDKFIDELAEKVLSPSDKASYIEKGGAKEFVRVLRENYETDSLVISEWYLQLNKELSNYVTLDLKKKVIEKFDLKNR